MSFDENVVRTWIADLDAIASCGGDYLLADAAKSLSATMASMLDEIAALRKGPNEAERLVRYRCAAIAGIATDWSVDDLDAVCRAETIAHSMLAAETEPSK